MDWEAISAELSRPLDRQHVAQRQQSGRSLSYIEAHHAVREANRIFGFDGWTRETVECRVVAERERKIGREPNTKDGWGVSYVAKVRVRAGAIIREGTGAGHGIDVDLGLAHESAIKEAESDAMKRALMTFGDPFGLALYDKTQSRVEDAATIAAEARADSDAAALIHAISECTDEKALRTLWTVAKSDARKPLLARADVIAAKDRAKDRAEAKLMQPDPLSSAA